jgi:hypothetical protein
MMGLEVPETCWAYHKCNTRRLVEKKWSTAARPMLYIIGVVGFVPFSWWWAWWCPKYFETPINTSSSASSWLFIHLHFYFVFRLTLQLETWVFRLIYWFHHKLSWSVYRGAMFYINLQSKRLIWDFVSTSLSKYLKSLNLGHTRILLKVLYLIL